MTENYWLKKDSISSRVTHWFTHYGGSLAAGKWSFTSQEIMTTPTLQHPAWEREIHTERDWTRTTSRRCKFSKKNRGERINTWPYITVRTVAAEATVSIFGMCHTYTTPVRRRRSRKKRAPTHNSSQQVNELHYVIIQNNIFFTIL